MSIATPNSWAVTYLDGRYISDEERVWDEISVRRQYGTETLAVLSEPAASLSVGMGGRTYTLRAPNQETHFYRHYRARLALGSNQSEILYHEVGYVTNNLRVRMEIDPRGNCQTRIETYE